jgi:hypothetical protein
MIMKKSIVIIAILGLSTNLLAGGAPHLKKGNLFVQGRAALGAVYGAGSGFVGGFEYGFQEDFLNLGELASTLGLGASFGYSGYHESWFGGKWKYTNIIILGNATYHAPIFDNSDIDPYAVLSIGANIGKVTYDGHLSDYSTPSHGGMVVGTAIGAKYFFSPQLAAVVELGYGMGILRLGLDYQIK